MCWGRALVVRGVGVMPPGVSLSGGLFVSVLMVIERVIVFVRGRWIGANRVGPSVALRIGRESRVG